MRVRDHLVISTASAALAAPFIGSGAVSLWAGSTLIDADHYVWYCLRHRCLSPVAAMRYFNQADPPRHRATRALHAPGALASVVLLSMFQRRLLPLALGMGLHVALDIRHVAQMDRARDRALQRDGYSCRACGTTKQPIGAHVWRQPRLLPSYRPQNLISLCTECHNAAHADVTGVLTWI